MPFNEAHQSTGNPIPASGWNSMVDEIKRLGREKLDTAGGVVSGPLALQVLAVSGGMTAADATLAGSLTVNGPATLRSGLGITGALGVSGTATVNGAGTFGTLRVGANAGSTDAAEISGMARIGIGVNQLRFTSKWQGFPDAVPTQAEISNDTDGFKKLMIVGNKSAPGNLRRVGLWDHVTVGTPGQSGYRLEVYGQSCALQFCNLSDARLKEDVRTIDDPLPRLARLRGVTFRWRDAGPAGAPERGAANGADAAEADRGATPGRVDATASGAPALGVVAQEVAEVFPELVTTIGEQGHLGVDYGGLTAVLLEAVKQLAASNAELRRRVAVLEGG
jgi:hypothetical protein